ncbi:MAG: hypothetical protein EPO21_14970 [Chloroflexota bacterium]|nr:MAG: hypothetical protein EPO21_14970 [Chloroflexota bacterium]
MHRALKQAFEDFKAALGSDRYGKETVNSSPAQAEPSPAVVQGHPHEPISPPEGRSPDPSFSGDLPPILAPEPPGTSTAPEPTADTNGGLRLARDFVSRHGPVILIAIVGAGILVWANLGGWLAPEPSDRDVVATYSDGMVTKEDLLGRLESHTEAERRTLATPEGLRHLVQDIAVHQVAERWAKERGLDDKNSVQHAMKHVAEDINLHDIGTQVHEGQIRVDEGEIQTYYEENRERLGNQPLPEVRDMIRETLHASKEEEYIDAYLRDLRARASVTVNYQLLAVPEPTEEELWAYYVSHQADFREPERVRVQEMRFEATSRDKDRESRDKAEKALARVQAGEDFAQVARELATNVGATRAEDGDEVVRGSRGQEFDEKVFSLREGDVSPVLKDGDAYGLVKVVEKRRERTRELDEVRAEIRRTLEAEAETRLFGENKEKTLFTIRSRRFTLGEFLEEYQHFAPDVQARYQSLDAKKALVDQLIDRLLVIDVGSSQLLDVKNKKEIEEARRHLLAQYLHEEEMQDKLEVSDDEVKQYYQQHRTHYVEPSKVKISYIRVGMGGTEDSRKRAKERIEEAAKRLQASKDRPEAFGEVAKEFSEDSKSAAIGGNLDSWLARNNDDLSHALAHDFTEAVFRLKVGETSRVISMGDSYYIVRVREKQDEKPLTLEQVSATVRQDIQDEKHLRALQDLEAEFARRTRLVVYDGRLRALAEEIRAAK